MAQSAAFGRPHQVDEQLTLEQQPIGKFALGGSLDGVHALPRRRVVLRHRRHGVAGEGHEAGGSRRLRRGTAWDEAASEAGRRVEGYFQQGRQPCGFQVRE